MSTPSDQLQHERQRRGLSQRDLARHLGVSASAISRWERGKDVPGPYYQQRLRALFEEDAQAQETTQISTTMTREKREKQQDSQIDENEMPLWSQSASTESLSPLSDSHELPAWYPSFQRDRSSILVVLLVLLAVLVVSSVAIIPILLQSRGQRSPSHPLSGHGVVGQLSFLSSGQVQDNSSQGIADTLRLQLQLQQSPSAGKQYYAWLLPDQDNPEAPTILLGTVIRQGHVGLVTYSDPQHTNLLASTSRLLVTEQDASITPLSPSTDRRDWRYIASIAQIHPSGTPYSPYGLLDHIRHLLVKEPTLEGHGLHGGLVIWLEHNTSRLVEWSTSARDDWQMGNSTAISQMRQQLIRLLIALDGISYAPGELPANTAYAGLVDAPTGNIGLLPFESRQDAFSLVTDVDFHLQGVAASPGVSIGQQQESAKILAVMDRINAWLKQVRDDDMRLLRMSDQQLQQPIALSLLNDLQINAVSAFSGQIDQTTGARQEGAQWVFQETHRLAEMEVTLA
jgi:transcriptional regulator with XRE-family HTH domain